MKLLWIMGSEVPSVHRCVLTQLALLLSWHADWIFFCLVLKVSAAHGVKHHTESNINEVMWKLTLLFCGLLTFRHIPSMQTLKPKIKEPAEQNIT